MFVFAVAVLSPVWTSAPTTWAGNGSNDPAVSQAPADWVRYTIAGDEFSLLLPVSPSMTSQTTHLWEQHKDRKERILSAYSEGVAFVIYAIDNPNRRQSLDNVIGEFNNRNQPFDGTRTVTLGGFSGKEYSIQQPDRSSVSQFYITDKHVYLFRAVGSSIVNPELAIAKFISSIKLEKKPAGMELVDGPGEEPVSAPLKPGEDAGRVLNGKEVAHKAIIVMKPQPQYTEDARKSGVAGTVVLRAVFSASGAVTSIRAVSGLPYGLTERAIVAARNIRFVPAVKDGHFVSMWFQLEYNFNLF
jgi:TonB family protein